MRYKRKAEEKVSSVILCEEIGKKYFLKAILLNNVAKLFSEFQLRLAI